MAIILALVALGAFASQALAQSPAWGQCGGQGWTGPTTCVAGYTCTYSNPYYSQCLPGEPTTTATTTATTTIPVTTTTGTNPTGTCTVGNIPASPAATANSRLPDPFKLQSGVRMTTKAQWACRREEIRQLLERTLYGEMPAKPNVTASYSGTTLTINVSAGGNSISFTAGITKPSGTGPFPAIIAYGGFASIPISSGIATINYNVVDIAVDGTSHGGGKFYTMYGTSATAGALVAWAWCASRIIDALELVPAAGIDTKRIGVTGCSRYGKGALAAGAWDTRFALTIPQESGTGGMSSYRIATAVDLSGTDTEQLSNIVLTATNWLAPSANAWANTPNNLPTDNHMLTALVAPRPLLSLDNDIAWLGPRGAYGAASAARKVWQALGAQDSMGFSQIGGHGHCSLPSTQNPEVAAFQTRFLLNGSANTTVFKSSSSDNFGYVESQWIDWQVPSLA